MIATQTKQPFSLIPKAFWDRISDPSAAIVGKIILSILVFTESMVCVFWIFVLADLGESYALMAAVPYFYIILSYTSLLIFLRLKRFNYFIFTQLIMLLVMPFFMQWLVGGYQASSGVAIWAILSPVGALMILGTRQSTPWFGLFLALSAVSWQLNSLFASNALKISPYMKDLLFAMNLVGVATILYAVMRYFQAQKARVMDALEIEQARSEKLLLNILPKSIAERLKSGASTIADSYPTATILFADLVGFTEMSADMPAEQLVDLLNQVFSRFDRLTEKYGLEKIKTIGDAYMVVGGVPSARADHSHAVADLALEMQQVLSELGDKSGKRLAMRIGIHSGHVVAGVIGTIKYSYDLWGDAVNIAARMEQHGLPNRIQVSDDAYQLLKDDYVFDARGQIAIKGKGKVEVYILKAKRK